MTDEAQDFLVAKTEGELENKNFPEAEKTAEELSALNQKEALSWFVKGKTFYLEEKHEEALSCLSKAAELEKENPSVWHMIGFTLIPLQRYDDAIEALDYVKAVQPKNASAIYALGICHMMKGDLEKANENISLAYSKDKNLSLKHAESVYAQSIELSKDVSSSLKAMIERSFETIRIAEMNGIFIKAKKSEE